MGAPGRQGVRVHRDMALVGGRLAGNSAYRTVRAGSAAPRALIRVRAVNGQGDELPALLVGVGDDEAMGPGRVLLDSDATGAAGLAEEVVDRLVEFRRVECCPTMRVGGTCEMYSTTAAGDITA